MKTITNEILTVGIQSYGAELSSVRGKDGIEYLWQANPAIWEHQSPILFPIVGKLADNRYRFNSKTYELSKHGFARGMEFNCIAESDTSLVFQLLPSDLTWDAYPFDFDLQVTYRLDADRLDTVFSVQNHGSSVMPFSIGAHPGFNLPGPIETCFLEFEKAETLDAFRFDRNGLLAPDGTRILTESRQLRLTPTLFDHDALIFLNHRSRSITLASDRSDRRVTVEFPEFPQLGIWAKPGAPYVCIEPWFGYDDPSEPAYGTLDKKPGILLLGGGEKFECTHSIRVAH